MEKKFFAFGFRFEKGLADRIRYYCREKTISLNTLVHLVLARLGDYHDRGIMRLDGKSRFLDRSDRADRKSTVLSLSADRRVMVRNLAFSYGVSMAEIIRLGMEMYLEMEEKDKRESDDIIHIYRVPRYLIHSVVISLYPALPPNRIPYPLLL